MAGKVDLTTSIKGIEKVRAGLAEIEKGISGAGKVADTNTQKFRAFGDSLISIGKELTLKVTAPIVAVGTAAVLMASDAVAAERRFSAVMGDMADSARAFSDELRKNLNLDRDDVTKTVAAFQQLNESMGLSQGASFEMSKGLTQISFDLAAFFKVSQSDVLDKLKAGMTGATKTLKDLGIVVDDNTIKQFAWQKGIATHGKELSKAQEALATYLLIVEKSKKMHGAAAAAMDDPIVKLQLISNKLKDAARDVGLVLMPILSKFLDTVAMPFVDWAQGVVQAFRDLSPETQNWIIGITAALAALGPALIALGTFIKLLGAMKIGLALITGPIGLIVVGFATLVAAGIHLYKNWDTVTSTLLDLWLGVKIGLLSIIDKILIGFSKLANFIPGLGKKIDEARKGLATLINENQTRRASNTLLTEMEKQKKKLDELAANAKKTATENNNLGKSAEEASEVLAKEAAAAKAAADQLEWMEQAIKGTLPEQEYMIALSEKAVEVLNNNKSAIDAYSAGIDHLGLLFNAGLIDVETYTLAIEKLKEEFEKTESQEKFRESVKTLFGEFNEINAQATQQLKDNLKSTFEDIFTNSKSIGEALKDFFDNIGTIILNRLAAIAADAVWDLIVGRLSGVTTAIDAAVNAAANAVFGNAAAGAAAGGTAAAAAEGAAAIWGGTTAGAGAGATAGAAGAGGTAAASALAPVAAIAAAAYLAYNAFHNDRMSNPERAQLISTLSGADLTETVVGRISIARPHFSERQLMGDIGFGMKPKDFVGSQINFNQQQWSNYVNNTLAPLIAGMGQDAQRQLLSGLMIEKWGRGQIEKFIGTDIPGFQTGGSFITSTQRLIRVGERGPERVTVKPLGHRSEGAGGGVTNVFNGPVYLDEIAMDKFQRGNIAALQREARRL